MSTPKIIAMYLPQFHQIPENDEFWGEGFTDWVTVKKAEPLYKGHQQPRIPLNNNYYDLSIVDSVEWQSKIAQDYGIYGFGVYHYWFNNEKNLLTRPAEILRDDDKITTRYFFIWDNANWKRSWSNFEGNAWAPVADSPEKSGPQILIPYILGREPDWEIHYKEVAKHFKNKKYIKKGNKPMFGIICYSKEIIEMCEYWEILAKRDGFSGIEFVFQGNPDGLPPHYSHYSYEPHYSAWIECGYVVKLFNRLASFFLPGQCRIYSYDIVWKNLLRRVKLHPEHTFVPGCFVNYDDSPRRGTTNSKIVIGVSPVKFEKYLKKLVKLVAKQKKDFIFLTAWNEWGEGAYLEPDEHHGYSYLQAVKDVIDD